MPLDPINHVVVLMLENHSFDQMLGALPGVDGVDPARVNLDKDGRSYSQAETTAPFVFHDPMHELEHVLRQLENDNGNFVLDYSMAYPETTPEDRQQVMGYFGLGTLPALHALASKFTVCDRWYSSVPGPTWANRFFVHSGTSLGRVLMPNDLTDSLEHPGLYFGYDQETIYDRLSARGITWRIYHGDIPQSLVLSRLRTPHNITHFDFMNVFYSDTRGQEEHFPQYSFIEPCYSKPGQNDDHPPHTIMRAQELLGNVYNALRANEPLWNSTLLVVLYDEHGGFYDHVSPPATERPDDHVLSNFGFDRLGVRVPAVLVSPWVDATVIRNEFDHTSLLKYLTDKWDLGVGLTQRVANAQSFGPVIRTTGAPRTDPPQTVQVPVEAATKEAVMQLEAPEDLNAQQKALIAFSEYLEREIEEPVGKPARTAAVVSGSAPFQVATAQERVRLFLAQQKAKAGGA